MIPGDVHWIASDPERVHLVPKNLANASTGGNAVDAAPGTTLGPSQIYAVIGPPFHENLEIAAFTYASLFIGCRIGAMPGVSFDEKGAVVEKSIAESDAFETGPIGDPNSPPFLACPNEFGTGSRFILHIPNGARVVDLASESFASIRAAMWRPDLTEVSFDSSEPLALLMRTKDGRIVKILSVNNFNALGAYLVADKGHEFADVSASESE